MPNNDARVVVLTNPSDFEFTHPYGGISYTLPVGKPVLFPYAIGDHLATHLARQIFIRKAPVRDDNASDGRGGEGTRSDRPLWDEVSIEAMKSKIMKNAYEEERAPVVSEAEVMKAKIDALNKDFVPETPKVAQPAEAQGTTGYKDKAEVIAELEKRQIKFDARKSKADLEILLK